MATSSIFHPELVLKECALLSPRDLGGISAAGRVLQSISPSRVAFPVACDLAQHRSALVVVIEFLRPSFLASCTGKKEVKNQ